MREIYLGKIIYDGFHYCLLSNSLNRIVTEAIMGRVKCTPQLEKAPSSHIVCAIENGFLFATHLIASISANDLGQVLEQEVKPVSIETLCAYRLSEPYCIDLVELTYDLHFPITFTGSLAGNQIFIDEAQYSNGITHKELCSFAFVNGCLQTTNSSICKSKRTFLEKIGKIWNDNILNQPATQLSQALNHRRYYYVSPIGSLRQHNFIIDVVCNYKSGGRVSNASLDWIFSHKTPVLRTHLKVETVAGSHIFRDKIYDLVMEATALQDNKLLEKLSAYQPPQ